MSKKNQNNYTDEFREQIAKLYMSGKPTGEIVREYGVTKTSIYSWVKKLDNSGSFRDKDNLSPQEAELIQLKKENKQLKMEVDLLKQAALILGRR
jgi:transposase